jgi:hypothetical protein
VFRVQDSSPVACSFRKPQLHSDFWCAGQLHSEMTNYVVPHDPHVTSDGLGNVAVLRYRYVVEGPSITAGPYQAA